MRNRVGIAAFAAALGVAGLAAPPASSAAARAGAPTPVTALAPFEQNGVVVLRWTNPRALDHDLVRIAGGADAPATVHDGRAVTLGSPRASKAVLRGLTAGRQYSVSVWTQRGSRLSRKTTTSFTTKSAKTVRMDGTFTGTVVDTAGDALRNANVLALDYNTFGRTFHTRTDDAGHFRLTVPAGRYLVGAIGSRAVGGSSDATGYLFAIHNSTVRPGATHQGLRFKLARAGAIRGKVTDLDGNPLQGVSVLPSEAPAYFDVGGGNFFAGSGPFTQSPTNRSGRYVVKGLQPGTEVPCFVGRSGYVERCASTSVAVRAGRIAGAGSTSLDTAVPVQHGSIVGTVRDAASHPVPNAVIDAFGPDSSGTEFHADKNGRFALHSLPVGGWQVCATRSGAKRISASDAACRMVRVVAGQTARTTLQFRLVGALSGVVRGPSGHRLGDVAVLIIHRTTNSESANFIEANSRGEWTASGMSPGTYSVCVQPAGFSSRVDPTGGRPGCLRHAVRVYANADRIGVDYQLAPAGAIAGKVTDSAGKPLANTGVIIYKGRGFNSEPFSAETDRDGHFRMPGLAPGNYRVCAERAYADGTIQQYCLPQRATVVTRHVTKVATIALPDGPKPLTVSVTDSSGHALSGVDVAILQACPRNASCPFKIPSFSTTRSVNARASQTTGIGGRAVFQDLQPGHYAACALAYYAASTVAVPASGFADKCASKTFSIIVSRTANATASIALDPGAAVSGLVQDSSGNPLRGVAMHVGGSAAFDYTSFEPGGDPLTPSPRNDIRTDSTGHYVVRSIEPGSQRVCGAPPRSLHVKYGCLSSAVSLPASTTTQAPTLTLNPAGMSAFGRTAMSFPRVRPLLPVGHLLPVSRRIPVINSSGWPEFRLLPRSKP